MDQLKAISIKLIASLTLLYIILGLFFNISFGSVFFITIVLGLLAYFIGDVGILPRTNNLVGTIADFCLAFIIVSFMVSLLTTYDNFFWIGFVAAIGVALFEYAFHRYFLSLTKNPRKVHLSNNRDPNLQTEISEEISPKLNENEEDRR